MQEDQPTPRSESLARVHRDRPVGQGWVLTILADNVHRVVPLDRELVLGRSRTADVYVNHSSLSRHHARVRPPQAPGDLPTIEDLASVNGTRVAHQRIPPNTPVALSGAEWVELGRVVVTLRQGHHPAPPRQIWVHDYFESLLDAECARADATGSSLAVLRLRFEAASEADIVQAALLALVRAHDVIGYYAPNEYEVLIAGNSANETDAIAEKVTERLGVQGLTAAIGIACYGRDGRSAAELLRHAGGAVRPALVAAASIPAADDAPVVGAVDAGVTRIAASDISVLIEGETGVGKEVLAERIHRASPRADKPLVKVNCAALSAGLMESALFGHVRGAFTGAVERNVGLIASAEGGTLFLDEVGEIPLAVQVKLLRVLEDRVVTPVGATKGRRIDVRFVAATNRDLDAEVSQGSFRADFYYRIAGVTVRLPPLRDRLDELPGLAAHFLRAAAAAVGLATPPVLTQAAVDELRAYPWPGNVRELRNMMERGILLGDGTAILPEHLPLQRMHALRLARALDHSGDGRALAREVVDDLRPSSPDLRMPSSDRRAPTPTSSDAGDRGSGDASLPIRLQQELDVIERRYVEEALQQAGGLQAEAAKILGVSRRTLINKMERLGVARPLKDRRGPGG